MTPAVEGCGAGLTVIITAGTFGGGLLAPTNFKLAVVMTLTVYHSLVFCQYTGRPHSHGTTHYYLATSLCFTIGAVLSILVADLVLPWYSPLAGSTLSTMSSSCMLGADPAARMDPAMKHWLG